MNQPKVNNKNNFDINMKHTNSGKAFTGREFDDLTTAQQKEACLQARNSSQKYLTFFRADSFCLSSVPFLFYF